MIKLLSWMDVYIIHTWPYQVIIHLLAAVGSVVIIMWLSWPE